MEQELAAGYSSASQRARVITERWGETNLYCISCGNDTVEQTRTNTKAVDFICPQCSAGYQLKAGRSWNVRRVPDGAYKTMMEAIRSDRVPNLLVMQYAPDWTVRNLVAVPFFALHASAIERRTPLGPTARRAGWVGCNILLGALPDAAKLRIVDSGIISPASVVRANFHRLRPLKLINPIARGWALDVLRTVQMFDRSEFQLKDVYAFENRLATLHPGNNNIRAKIRQQLQVLRDLGLIAFEGRGRYRLLKPTATLEQTQS